MELPNQRARDRAPPRKFSTFIKRMIVELDRDPTLYPDGNIVEVCREENSGHFVLIPDFSGLEDQPSSSLSMALP